MKALTRMIRSLFGLSKSSADDGETDPVEGDVTVEREAVDVETEAAVKGTGDDAGEVAEDDEDAEPEAETVDETEPETEVAESEVETDGERSEAEAADEEADQEVEVDEEAGAEDEETETEKEAEEETEAESEPEEGADVSVEEINGIGPTYSERLAEAGLGTIAALADSDPATVAEASQASESRAEEWIERAAGWD